MIMSLGWASGLSMIRSKALKSHQERALLALGLKYIARIFDEL